MNASTLSHAPTLLAANLRGLLHHRLVTRLAAVTPMTSRQALLQASGGYGTILKRVETLIATLDMPRFMADIYPRFESASPAPGFSKYLDVPSHLARALRTAERLSLLTPPPSEIIFDIGAGAGFFPFVCHSVGHAVNTMDIPGNPFYAAMREWLGVPPCLIHAVQSRQLLPQPAQRYSLVTALQIMFDRHDNDAPWDTAEWQFFLNDLRDHQLQPKGRIWLGINSRVTPAERAQHPRNIALFRHLGASMPDPYTVLFSSPPQPA